MSSGNGGRTWAWNKYRKCFIIVFSCFPSLFLGAPFEQEKTFYFLGINLSNGRRGSDEIGAILRFLIFLFPSPSSFDRRQKLNFFEFQRSIHFLHDEQAPQSWSIQNQMKFKNLKLLVLRPTTSSDGTNQVAGTAFAHIGPWQPRRPDPIYSNFTTHLQLVSSNKKAIQ